MKNSKKIKQRVSGLLAACMVATMLPPAVPVNATTVGYGDTSMIRFDIGDGPDAYHEEEQQLTNNQMIGKAGHTINSFDEYQGLPQDNSMEGYSRPALPTYRDGIWNGYVFEGWYNESGNKVTKLPFAFPYADLTTYTAKWIGNTDITFDFTTKHQRKMTTINGEEISIQIADDEVSAWGVGSTIATSYRRGIPGYQFGINQVVPEKRMKYGESSAQGTGATIGKFSSVNHSFIGTMPNEDVVVTYSYQPDTSKKFQLKVEYVDAEGNTLAVPVSEKYSAEAAIGADPKAVEGYLLKEAVVIEEQTNDDNVYSTNIFNSGFDNNKVFSGKMPNQKVTIRYTYERDPDYRVSLNVLYLDENGENLRTQGLIGDEIPPAYSVEIGEEMLISAPYISGYQEAKHITWEPQPGMGVELVDDVTVKVVAGTSNSTIKITYFDDVDNPDFWNRISFQSGLYGSLDGNVETKRFRVGEYDIEDITAGIDLIANENYLFDGWYLLDENGNRSGEKLDTIELRDGDTYIQAHFIEDDSKWYDITFRAAANGNISSVPSQHISAGTRWGDIQVPEINANTGYIFNGWYDSENNKVNVESNPIFVATMEYTARFTSIIVDPSQDALNIPNASGRIIADGYGVITLADFEEERSYVLTDKDDIVLETLTGNQLVSGKQYTKLQPSTIYKVYELAAIAPQVAVGSLITNLDEDLRSVPARVKILAIGENYQLESDDENNKIIISPVAENTEYAVLDVNGNVILQPNSNQDGWVFATAETISLSGLESESLYTVVARKTEANIAPQEVESLGSPVYVYVNVPMRANHTIEVLDGKIAKVNETLVNDSIYLNAKAEDSVKISAEQVNETGQSFKQWQVLIGTIDGFNQASQSYYSPTFSMPNKNLVLRAVYEKTPIATYSNASVEYTVNTGHEGEVALDLSGDKEDSVLSYFLTDGDLEAMNQGKQVVYRVQFKKRTASAKERNLIANEMTDFPEALQGGWALETKLLRYVDGNRRELDSDHLFGEFEVLIQIDEKYQDKFDYQLWKIAEDGSVELISMLPDPNTASNQQEVFRFYGEKDAIYILTYAQSYDVTIKDSIRNYDKIFTIRKGDSLNNLESYQTWLPNTSIPDVNGTLWHYVGLSTKSSKYVPYDVDSAVTKDITLYAYYTNEDSEWKLVKSELEKNIQEADDLKNNPSICAENKTKLTTIIEAALELLDSTPKPTVQQLIEMNDTIRTLIDAIRNDNCENGGDGGNENGNGNENGGDNGNSGSGGGSGSSSSSSSKSSSIKVGIDGQWKCIDQENHKWVFELKDGTNIANNWAYLSYTFNEKTTNHYYYFNNEGIMSSGWFLDKDGRWYYLSTNHDGWFGHMVTGWHYDSADRQWYYFDPVTGAAVSGWNEIDGKWYYFTAGNGQKTYEYHAETDKWSYLGNQERPWGSLYIDEVTPDNFRVDHDGVWVK